MAHRRAAPVRLAGGLVCLVLLCPVLLAAPVSARGEGSEAPQKEGGKPAKAETAAEPKKPAEPAKLDVGAASEIGGKADAASAEEPAPAPSGPVQLRYKYEVNQRTWYEVDHKVDILTQKDQIKQTARNESHTVKHYRVISVDESGSALLELSIDKVRMSARADDGDEIAYDSESKDEPPRQFENVRQVVGKPLARISVSPWGEIKSVVRLNAPAAAENEPADADAGNNFLIVLPNRPIRPGESWNDKADVRVQVGQGNLTQSVTILRNYELKSVEDGLATIRVASTILTPVRDPKIEGQLIQRTPSGTIVFDVEKGAIVSRTLSLDRTVIGVFSDNSSMRVVSEKVEKLVPRDKVLRTADGDKAPARN